MTDPIETAIARARALPCFTAPKDIRPLDGGITNLNLRLRDGGRDYVVRLGHDIPEHGIMRFNELAISRAAHEAGLSPRIHHAEPGALVLDWVEATPLTEADLRDPATLDAATDLIARVHRDVLPHVRGPILAFHVFHVVRDYAATLRGLGSPHVPVLPDLLDRAARLEAAIGPVDLVLGHNDLLPANILRGEGRLWLVDWEYGGLNSPLFDLGGFASNIGLDPDAEARMLARYFGSAARRGPHAPLRRDEMRLAPARDDVEHGLRTHLRDRFRLCRLHRREPRAVRAAPGRPRPKGTP